MRIPDGLRWKATGRTLGTGGQGTVVEVQDRSDPAGIKYDLKGIAKGKSVKAYQRFEREVKAVQALAHHAIPRIVDWSLDANFPYYVMEFVESAISLKKALEQKANPFYARPLPALGFFRQLVEVIAACEPAKILHRDLSPANVLLLPDGRIRVIDFGLCQFEGAEVVTLVDEGVGTQN